MLSLHRKQVPSKQRSPEHSSSTWGTYCQAHHVQDWRQVTRPTLVVARRMKILELGTGFSGSSMFGGQDVLPQIHERQSRISSFLCQLRLRQLDTSQHHHHTGATTNNVLVVNSKSWPPEWMVDAKWCGCRWSWSLKRVKWSIVKSAGEVISGNLNGLERLITAYCACFLLAELRRHLDWNTHQTTACSH